MIRVDAATVLLRRTGTGNSTTLDANAPAAQNYIDVAAGTGSLFVKDNYIVIEDAVVGRREYMRVQYVDGDRLWFGAVSLAGFTLHPLVLIFALSGCLMISRIRIPKP